MKSKFSWKRGLIAIVVLLFGSVIVAASNKTSSILAPISTPTVTATPKVLIPTIVITSTSGTPLGKSGSSSLYPNSSLTPGDTFKVTAAQVCVSGYSSSVRNVSETEKKQVYAEYGLSFPQPPGAYEADHFISLELGGDNDIKNLWPEPANPTPGFHQKDVVENYLHSEVCSGKISLAEAQNEIKTDWYKVYLSMSGSTNTYLPPATANADSITSGVTTGSATGGTSTITQAGHATGKCNDGTETYATNHQGACSHHQGVAQWY